MEEDMICMSAYTLHASLLSFLDDCDMNCAIAAVIFLTYSFFWYISLLFSIYKFHFIISQIHIASLYQATIYRSLDIIHRQPFNASQSISLHFGNYQYHAHYQASFYFSMPPQCFTCQFIIYRFSSSTGNCTVISTDRSAFLVSLPYEYYDFRASSCRRAYIRIRLWLIFRLQLWRIIIIRLRLSPHSRKISPFAISPRFLYDIRFVRRAYRFQLWFIFMISRKGHFRLSRRLQRPGAGSPSSRCALYHAYFSRVSLHTMVLYARHYFAIYLYLYIFLMMPAS